MYKLRNKEKFAARVFLDEIEMLFNKLKFIIVYYFAYIDTYVRDEPPWQDDDMDEVVE